MRIPDIIKDTTYGDFRKRAPIGVLCEIVGAETFSGGFGTILNVIPIDSLDGGDVFTSQIEPNNVFCVSAPGAAGLPKRIGEKCYAYVITNDTSEIEASIAFLVPKEFVGRGRRVAKTRFNLGNETMKMLRYVRDKMFLKLL